MNYRFKVYKRKQKLKSCIDIYIGNEINKADVSEDTVFLGCGQVSVLSDHMIFNSPREEVYVDLLFPHDVVTIHFFRKYAITDIYVRTIDNNVLSIIYQNSQMKLFFTSS